MGEMENTSSLKETLYDQSLTIANLCVELEEERKASSSAAEEALAMIMRLQVEKAAVKMEASHYKRMTEEKLHHAEVSLAGLEQVLHQKELEIEFLKHKLMAYEHRLANLGIRSPKFKFTGTSAASFLNSLNAFHDKKGNASGARRHTSMPAAKIEKLISDMGIMVDEKSSSSPISITVEEYDPDPDQESESGNLKEKNEHRQVEGTEKLPISTGNSVDTPSGISQQGSSFGPADSAALRNGAEAQVLEENKIKAPEGTTSASYDICQAKNMTKIANLLLHKDQVNPTIGTSAFQANIEELKMRLKQLEGGKWITDEGSCGKRNTEQQQLRSLQQIFDELSLLQLHVRDLHVQKRRRTENPIVVSLVEDMLHFWL